MSFNYYPYCFYQYRDESTNTYNSYLSHLRKLNLPLDLFSKICTAVPT